MANWMSNIDGPIADLYKKTIEESGAAKILEKKRLTPQIFPEYGRLMEAKVKFTNAKRELERAQAAWEKLGK